MDDKFFTEHSHVEEAFLMRWNLREDHLMKIQHLPGLGETTKPSFNNRIVYLNLQQNRLDSVLFKGTQTADSNTIITDSPLAMLYPKSKEIPDNLQLPKGGYEGGRKVLINGQIREWQGPTQKIYSPILIRESNGPKEIRLTRKLVGELPQMGEKEATEAINAAYTAYNQGQGEWPRMSLAERIKCMEKFLKEMEAVQVPAEQGTMQRLGKVFTGFLKKVPLVNGLVKGMEKTTVRDDVIKLLMYEICKTREDSEKEYDRTYDYIKRTIDAAKAMDENSTKAKNAESTLYRTKYQPLGVTLCMGPANYPLNETFTTLIPALLMGNTIVCKLPRLGGLSNVPLFEAFQKCFPKGTVNFVSGEGSVLVPPIMGATNELGKPKVTSLAFIGGEDTVKKHIIPKHPDPFVRLNAVLGLGAKNPGIILPDVEKEPKMLEETIKKAVKGALSYNGQRCTAIKLLYVPESIADKVVRMVSAEVNNYPMGMPFQAGVKITPIANIDYYRHLVNDAVGKKAEIANSGGGDNVETLFKPVVLDKVTPDMEIFHKEQFGPIIPIVRYKDKDEKGNSTMEGLQTVINQVTASNYGQQASVFGHDIDQLVFVDEGLKNQVCRLHFNEAPQRGPDEIAFVGRKDSGKGILSISDALTTFSLPYVRSGSRNDRFTIDLLRRLPQ